MRRSLEDIKHMVVPEAKYHGSIPADLKEYYCYLKDSGHVILCIPTKFQNESKICPDDYETGVPVKYVLSHSYKIVDGYVYVDVPYTDFGVDVPEDYHEYWSQSTDPMLLKCGSVFPSLVGKNEGVFFGSDSRNYILVYNFYQPTAKEIDQIRFDKPFEIRMLPLGDVIWIMSKCGDLSWMNSHYSPHLSSPRSIGLDKNNTSTNSILQIMTDAKTAIIQSIRLIRLSEDFSAKLALESRRLKTRPFDKQKYFADVSRVHDEYTTEELADMAEICYKLN